MEKDKDFDNVIEIMKNNFQWKGDVGKGIFNYTNELIKATKLFLEEKPSIVVCENKHCIDGIVDEIYGEKVYCSICHPNDKK
ncbi:MAG: hypothetical protein PF487_13180 [Bacteroidales bacterium]|jgi:hypothetical protein|nr:hypothetical protein [Bacteroidales bacterium]